jgi:hypothetical protein
MTVLFNVNCNQRLENGINRQNWYRLNERRYFVLELQPDIPRSERPSSVVLPGQLTTGSPWRKSSCPTVNSSGGLSRQDGSLRQSSIRIESPVGIASVTSANQDWLRAEGVGGTFPSCFGSIWYLIDAKLNNPPKQRIRNWKCSCWKIEM